VLAGTATGQLARAKSKGRHVFPSTKDPRPTALPGHPLVLYCAKVSALVGLECPECGGTFDAERLQTVCEACDSPLLARYDLTRLSRTLTPDQLALRPAGLWRWKELLPVRDPVFRLSLGEGDTPLLPTNRIANDLGLSEVLVKDEGVNPSGSFKARGLSVAVARGAELGVEEFGIPTAGNAGGALAMYAARHRRKAHVFMPTDAPKPSQLEVRAAGADLHLVDGLIDEAGRQAALAVEASGWFNVSTFREPYRVEGKKTMGLELAEAFGWDLPEVIVYPTGGGTGLVGMWKAFEELEALGWIGGRRPRLVAVQADGCAPVVQAFETGADRIEAWEGATTRAAGLRVPKPYADRLILRALRESDGLAVRVTEQAIDTAERDLACQEGILACPEGAATLAGLRHLVIHGEVGPKERVVLFNTGSGLKYLQ
jgi:threonine synthase